MPYDERLAQRIRETLPPGLAVSECRMFGGLAFLVEGNMCVAAGSNGAMLVRVGAQSRDGALGLPHVRPMLMGKKQVAAFVYVDAPALRTRPNLKRWIDRALAFVETLPAKRSW